MSVLVAIDVCRDDYRQVLGVCEEVKEDKASWQKFLRRLKDRGLKGVDLLISDKCPGWWKLWANPTLMPAGSVAWFTGIATC